jgi:serine O-acetyltransferase
MGFFQSVREDIQSVVERDPAATSLAAILLCYPGLHAVWAHHFTNWLWRHKFKLLARWVSQVIRLFTGIEIHPGARIGRRVFIDHGMGVVIGETAIVGNDVTLYQGVTLGGTGKEKGKRHPTVRDGVFVGNNANILGNITIGENSRVGAGSVVLRDVPPNSTVVGVPAHVVYREGQRVLITDPREIQDPLSNVIVALAEQVNEMRAKLGMIVAESEAARKHASATQTLTTEDDEREEYRKNQLTGSEIFHNYGGGI